MAVEVETPARCEFGESIRNAQKALTFCLCNKFIHADNFLKELDGRCMYHVISRATISYLQAIFTYEQQQIDIAYEKVKDASQLCNSLRKKHTWGEMVTSWVGKTNFDEFSEVELHAELCYAECQLERAMLTFIQDENLISFIKGGLKIRTAYSVYRNCFHALQQKPKSLETSKNKADFESGVYMGMGTFNVLLSLLPARTLRLLEWVGFSGHKRNGLGWLDKGFQGDGLRSPMCTITLLGYQVVVAPLLGIDDTDIEYVKKILEFQLDRFPDGSIFLYFSGRLKQTQGLIKEALTEYQKAVSVSIDWHQVHHICYWEMMWCYSFMGQWQLAAEYAEKLSTESKWSKCSYTYMYAAFLAMHQFELRHSGDAEKIKEGDNMEELIESLLNKAKKHKQRIAGKSIPFEKFTVSRVDKYNTTGCLVLPGLEIIHVWNGFTMLSKDTKTLEYFLSLSNMALEELKETQGYPKEHHDNVCLCMLLKGICLRRLNRTDEAEEMLKYVAASPLSLYSCKMDSYLPPYAAAEIGALYGELGLQDKALKQYQYILKHYSKYGLESRLHFRVHSGIESIKEAKKMKLQNKSDNGVTNSSSDEEFFDVSDVADAVKFSKIVDSEEEEATKTAICVGEHHEINETGVNEHNTIRINNENTTGLYSNGNNETRTELGNVNGARENASVSSSLSSISINLKESNNTDSRDSVCSDSSELSATIKPKSKLSRLSPLSWFTKSSPSVSKQSSRDGDSPTLSQASSNISPTHESKEQVYKQITNRETGL